MDKNDKPRFTQQELDAAPKIRINGKDWPVPVFGPRQNRRIVPYINKLSQVKITDLTTDDMDNLYNIIYWAINRAHPDVQERDFLDWEVPIDEAMEAVPIIAKQTGLMKLKKPGEAEGTPEGEAVATSQSIGISSSQE